MYAQNVIFELAGKSLGKIAQAESFIRLSPQDLVPGKWRLRVRVGMEGEGEGEKSEV